jgi:hypothetical protein
MCGRHYKYKRSLKHHIKYECFKEPTFACSFCSYKSKTKGNLKLHTMKVHLTTKKRK